jgi:hypothetical protein
VAVTECPVCGVALTRAGGWCEIPGCPCFGLRGAEAEAAAHRWRSRPSMAQARTFGGADAGTRNLDGMHALDLLLDDLAVRVAIEHRDLE